MIGGGEKGECNMVNMFIMGHVVSYLLGGLKKICYQWEVRSETRWLSIKELIAIILLFFFPSFCYKYSCQWRIEGSSGDRFQSITFLIACY